MNMLNDIDIDNIWNMLFDAEDAQDAVVWLWATVGYSVLRVIIERVLSELLLLKVTVVAIAQHVEEAGGPERLGRRREDFAGRLDA